MENCISDSIVYLGIYGVLFPMKSEESLNSFQESTWKWVPTNCPCRLCKVYVGGVGFIECCQLGYWSFSNEKLVLCH